MHLPDARFKKHLKRLLPTTQEWHAFIIGFGEVMPPWPPHHNLWNAAARDVSNEYHYYMAGRTLGFFLLLLYITTLIHFLRG